jgi:hypothetical protein
MSLMNGLASFGSSLNAFAGDVAKDEEARARPSLLNGAAPPEQKLAPPPTSAPSPLTSASDSAGHGNALDPATVSRAHQVYLGLVDRGMDPTTAIGFAANAVQESRADPGTNPGDMGASHGLLQWRGDRLANYVAKFGHAPEQGNLNEQLDYIMHEVSGPEAGAWKAIQASAADPASRAGAVSQYFERPKDTAAEIARRGYIANQLAGHFARVAAPSSAGSV